MNRIGRLDRHRSILSPQSPAATTAVIGMATGGSLMALLSPLLLGSLLEEHRIDAIQLGRMATLELFSLGLFAAFAAAWIPTTRLRPVAAAAITVLMLANLATLVSEGAWILAVRALAGCAGGVLLWLISGYFARLEQPARLVAVYGVVQSLVALALAALYSSLVLPRFGANGGFVGMIVFDAALLALLGWLPEHYSPLGRDTPGHGAHPAGWVAIGATFLFLAAIMATWVYVVPVGRQSGLSNTVAGNAVAAGIAMQMLGGVCASLLASRLRPIAVILGSNLAGIAVAFLLYNGVPAAGFVALVGSIGFLWVFTVPLFTPFIIEADPSRRTAALAVSAQLLGCGAGPWVASWIVHGHSVYAALAASAILFLLSALASLSASYYNSFVPMRLRAGNS